MNIISNISHCHVNIEPLEESIEMFNNQTNAGLVMLWEDIGFCTLNYLKRHENASATNVTKELAITNHDKVQPANNICRECCIIIEDIDNLLSKYEKIGGFTFLTTNIIPQFKKLRRNSTAKTARFRYRVRSVRVKHQHGKSYLRYAKYFPYIFNL